MNFIEEIPSTVFTDLKEIGHGTFASIYSAIFKKTNTRVAVKAIVKDEASKEFVQNEIDVHKSLHHPLIAEFLFDFDTEHLKILVMELIDGCSLLDKVNLDDNFIGSIQAQHIFVQLASVVQYLHNTKKVAHHDLKLENIMVDVYGHIRVIDFGFSMPISQTSPSMCGSVPYLPPEILQGTHYGPEADIWGMGVILFSLISGRLPFFDDDIGTMAFEICEQEPPYPSIVQSNCLDIMKKMLCKDYTKRITINEIAQHSYVTSCPLSFIDFEALACNIEYKNVEERIKAIENHTYTLKIDVDSEIFKLNFKPNSLNRRSSQMAVLGKSTLKLPFNNLQTRRMTQVVHPKPIYRTKKAIAHSAFPNMQHELSQSIGAKD